MKFIYTVSATFTDARVGQEWIDWLKNGHIAEVLRVGGASNGEIVRIDGDALTIEARYQFPSRDAFAKYQRDHAPRLRAEGVEKFPTTRGIAYRRSTGEVLAAVDAS